MSEIVDRLRDAARAVGETIHEVPPFEASAGRTRSARSARRSWGAPLVAAVAVTGVIAGGVVVTQAGRGDDVAGPSAAGAGPEYFAMTGDDGITFYRADTGAKLPSRASGRRFALVDAARGAFYTTVEAGDCKTLFMRVTPGRGEEAARVDTLPITLPDGTAPASLAVSADGTKLAYGLRSCEPGVILPGQLGVADLNTGKSRMFVSSSGSRVTNVSITADGRSVAFQFGPVFYTGATPPPVADPTTLPTMSVPSVIPTGSASEGAESAVATATSSVSPTVPAVPPSGSPAVPADAAPDPTVTVSIMPTPILAATLEAKQAPTAMATLEATPVPTLEAKPIPTVTATLTATPVPARPTSAPEPPARAEATTSLPPGKYVEPTPAETVTAMPVSPPTEFAVNPATGFFELGSESPEVRLLDTEAEGEDLDRARKVELKADPAMSIGLRGVRISPDGRSFVAMFGKAIEDEDVKELRVVPGPVEIALFDTENGKQTDVLYRDDQGGSRLIDADASGEHFLVRRDQELGVVSSGQYRTLPGFHAFSDPLNSNIGW
ncbi:hypothetical protein [Streptosporangium sp. NPDC000396]|uniref:hypothetical protein n=1 Tax=Streptosporangium sp. NPDC000396 TaxID=3366185 RepID=UPI003688294D